MAQTIDTLKRRLETILGDFKRARATWKEIGEDALSDANTLVNDVIQSRYVDDTSYWHPGICHEFPDITQAYNTKISWTINQHLEKLRTIVQKMKKQQDKMNQQISELGVICKRASDLRGQAFVEHEPLYKTCPMRTFVTRFESIVQMYGRAQNVLDSLLGPEGFTHIRSREEGLALLSIWIHHPSIDENAIQEFEELCEIEVFC